MARKQTTEFFEVFGRTPRESAATKGGSAQQPGHRKKPATRRRARAKVERPPGGIVVPLSREAIVTIACILVGLVVISHVWGYRRGRRITIAANAAQSGIIDADRNGYTENATTNSNTETEGARTLVIGNSTTMETPFYTVRIIGLKRLDRVREIRDYLQQMGYDAFVVKPKRESGYTVNIGRFAKDSQAKATKRKFAEMKYQGSTWFETAYIIQITDKRSIVE